MATIDLIVLGMLKKEPLSSKVGRVPQYFKMGKN